MIPPDKPEEVNNIVIPIIGWVFEVGMGLIGGAVAFTVGWLIRVESRMDRYRAESNQGIQEARDAAMNSIKEGDDKIWKELHRIHDDFMIELGKHREEFGEYKDESASYRTNVMVMMATKSDLRHEMAHMLELLDARMNTKLEPIRQARMRTRQGAIDNEPG